jgi:cysteine desulfurase/selenocysteine lyase
MKTPLTIQKIREDFPALQQTIRGKPLIYFDNAATAQKPVCVIDAIKNFYSQDCANVHRGVHTLSERATLSYETTRKKTQNFIHAASTNEIIFTKGTTEAINLVAQSFGRSQFKPSDEIIISHMEHHSNIVPWQMICEQTGAQLKVIPVNEDGELILEAYEKLLNSRTKLVALTHISNTLGTINPVKKIIDLAHQNNTPVLLDGAQAIVHEKIDVQELDCDFFIFSSHKLFGPSGLGILYGKEKLLAAMPPYQGGGNMIHQVSFEKTEYRELPYKFEAGTPPIANVIGFGAAIDYLNQLNSTEIFTHEKQLLNYAIEKLSDFPQLRLIGNAKNKAPIISFVLNDIHAHDVATILDSEGIAVRAGHHCCMPLMERFNVAATVRASFAFYNTFEEIDVFVKSLQRVRDVFKCEIMS